MQEITSIYGLSNHTNIEVYSFHDKYIILYDDHQINAKDLFEKWGIERIEDVSSRDFWSFVEFDLSGLDDDWLLAGMELGLINHAVVIGQTENSNMRDLNNLFESSDGEVHELFDIYHLNYSLGCRGCLGDNVIKEPYYLDCFTTECENNVYAWPEAIFREKYYDNEEVRHFMHKLINRSTIITICREPTCCGGLGESNKILGYLDHYFFDGCLDTIPIR